MNRQYHKGLIFLNDLNLTGSKSIPLGRIDDDFLAAVKAKLDFVVNYAHENELKIVVFGDVFKKGFSYDAMSLFVSCFKEEKPLIICKKQSDSLKFLNMFDHFDIHEQDGILDTIQIVTDIGVEEYHLDYQPKLDSAYSGLDFNVGIDAKGILVTDGYSDTESPYDGIEAIICGKWESVSNEMSHKAHAASIIRQSIKDKDLKPSFPVWTATGGVTFVKVPHQEFVFDDFDYSERIEKETGSEFTEMLLAATRLDFNGDSIPSVIDDLFAKNEISGDIIDELKHLHQEVSVEKEYR